MKKGRELLLLLILIAVFIAFNYTSLDSFVTRTFSNEETIIIDRVIDGDTVVYKTGNISQSVRLLGINTPEKGEYLYSEAKKFLEEHVLNLSLIAEKQGKDRYDRELVYLYNGKKNINKEIVKEGYANYYFPEGKDAHFSEFAGAWEECISSNKNLCEKSLDKCSECIELKEWDFDNQKLGFYNACEFDCSLNKWTIKDEGRKKFVFQNFNLENNKYVYVVVGNKTDTSEKLYWKGETYVWTSSGDSIFLRDSQGKLVLWRSQGY